MSNPQTAARSFVIKLGRTVKTLMRMADMKQAELGRQLELPQSEVSKILAGKRVMTVEQLHMIAGAFGVTVAELCGMETTFTAWAERNPHA